VFAFKPNDTKLRRQVAVLLHPERNQGCSPRIGNETSWVQWSSLPNSSKRPVSGGRQAHHVAWFKLYDRQHTPWPSDQSSLSGWDTALSTASLLTI